MTDNPAVLTETKDQEKQPSKKYPWQKMKTRLIIISVLALIGLPSIFFYNLKWFSLIWAILTFSLSVYNYSLTKKENNQENNCQHYQIYTIIPVILSFFILSTTIFTWILTSVFLQIVKKAIS